MFVLWFNRDLGTYCIKENLGCQTLQKSNVFPSHLKTPFQAKDSIAFEELHVSMAYLHMKIFRRHRERDKKAFLKEKTKYEMQEVGYQNWTLTAETRMLFKLSRAENCKNPEIYISRHIHRIQPPVWKCYHVHETLKSPEEKCCALLSEVSSYLKN